MATADHERQWQLARALAEQYFDAQKIDAGEVARALA